MRVKTSFLLLLLSALLVGSAVAEDQSDRYMVEMELWIDGEQRGTPMLVVVPGEPASVAVGDSSGSEGWKIELLVEPPVASEGAPTGAIWLNLTIQERLDGEWTHLADSLLGVPEGRSASMSVVEPGVEQAGPQNSLVYLTARASRLRPGETAH